MADSTEEPIIAALLRYNTWANLKLIDACMGLSDEQLELTAPGTFGTVRHTLTHMVGNDENYLSLLTGVKPENPLRRGQTLALGELRAREQAAGVGLEKEAAQASMRDVFTAVFQGEESSAPKFVVLIQAIQHNAEHRAHISTILTGNGIEFPTIDGWAYGEELGNG